MGPGLGAGAFGRLALTEAGRRLAHRVRLERRDPVREPLARRRRPAAAQLVLALVALVGCARSTEQLVDPPGRTTDGRPHVVVYCIDTLRADHLGAYGYERDDPRPSTRSQTRRVVFENAISQAPWTLPSVTSYLTSTFPDDPRRPQIGRGLPGALQTMAETMREAGYQTVGFVQNAFAGSASGADRGFDVSSIGCGRVTQRARVDRHQMGELVDWLDRAQEPPAPLPLRPHGRAALAELRAAPARALRRLDRGAEGRARRPVQALPEAPPRPGRRRPRPPRSPHRRAAGRPRRDRRTHPDGDRPVRQRRASRGPELQPLRPGPEERRLLGRHDPRPARRPRRGARRPRLLAARPVAPPRAHPRPADRPLPRGAGRAAE